MNGTSIEILLDGRVAPATRWEPAQPGLTEQFDGGVYYANGKVCELGRIKKPWSVQKSADLAGELFSTVPGQHVFGGMLQNEHFGHFIAENLARLWALDHLSSLYRSVVFYLRRPEAPVAKFVLDMLWIVNPDVQVQIVKTPTQFEMLAVPQDLTKDGYTVGHPLLATIQEKLKVKDGEGAKKIYVSRSRLPRYEGGILGDRLIDAYMEEAGYTVIFPEMMPIRAQLTAYAAADKLVFAEGSALHLYALVADPKQEVFVIWRRRKYTVFDWQIQTFGGRALRGEPCIEKLWVPESEVPDAAHGKAKVSFTELSNQLREYGFIDSAPWNEPLTATIEEELEAIVSHRQRKYVLLPTPVKV
jgi:hypothetical protein